MRGIPLPLVTLLVGSLVSSSASAESLAGVCPDGSAFVVQQAADIPCARAKLVDPSELPPLRPELLPRPYKWMVDQEARDPKNPYNLVDEARRIRELRAGSADPAEAPTPAVAPLPPREEARLSLGESELRDLVKLVALRQQVAPAQLVVEDIHGRPQLYLQLAYSPAFEGRALEAAPAEDGRTRIIVFTARAGEPIDFYPNFLVTQGGATFRPDSLNGEEVRFLVGAPGPLAKGAMAVGYLRIPERFDPGQPMDLWWNDRSIEALLEPSP
jgi:hypothetical protein